MFAVGMPSTLPLNSFYLQGVINIYKKNTMVKYFIYVRVSSEEQRDNCRYQHQERSLIAYAESRQWEYEVFKEVRSGKDISHRPVIKDVLQRLENKEADGLAFIAVDRLTRSVEDAVNVLNRSKKQGWKMYVSNIFATDPVAWETCYLQDAVRAQSEIRVLSQRTKEGMAQSKNKDKFGAKALPTYSQEALDRIVWLREKRLYSFPRIAEELNKGKIPVARPDKNGNDKWTADKTAKAYHRGALGKYPKPKETEQTICY